MFGKLLSGGGIEGYNGPERNIRLMDLWKTIPYSSKFSWYNSFVIFVINLSFTKNFATKIIMGVVFSGACI